LDKVRVAVIGYGFLGKWHAEKANNLENAILVAIVESDQTSQKTAKEKFPDLQIVSNVKEIMDLIDAAIVVTPTSTHYGLVQLLLSHNKHVFCEKPLTSKLENSLKIKNQLNEKNLVLQVGHSERFHEVWDKKEYYSSYLQSPCSVKISRFAPFKGRATDVDVVQDLMIHDLDLLNMLLNDDPEEITSIGFKSLTSNWDHVETLLKFKNGNQSSIIVGRNSVTEVRQVEITNKKGTLLIDLLNTEISRIEKKEVIKTKYNKRDHLYLEQEEFYLSIINKTQPRVDCEAGVAAVRLVNKVLESLELSGEL
jgi:predicted dehydrogenase